MQSRHQPIENIRSRQLVSYPFTLLSMVTVGAKSTSPVPNFAKKSRKVNLLEKQTVIRYLNMRIEICNCLPHFVLHKCCHNMFIKFSTRMCVKDG